MAKKKLGEQVQKKLAPLVVFKKVSLSFSKVMYL